MPLLVGDVGANPEHTFVTLTTIEVSIFEITKGKSYMVFDYPNFLNTVKTKLKN